MLQGQPADQVADDVIRRFIDEYDVDLDQRVSLDDLLRFVTQKEIHIPRGLVEEVWNCGENVSFSELTIDIALF
jgi:hypothetical protein